jgi:hypothetical protein
VDGPDAVDNVPVCDGDIGIAVKANGKWPCRERVVSVEGVADETGGIHSGAALKGRAGLDVVV